MMTQLQVVVQPLRELVGDIRSMAVGTAPFFGWAVVIEGTPNSFENPSPWGVPLFYETWEGDSRAISFLSILALCLQRIANRDTHVDH